MGEVALDASVVIGLLEPNEAHHDRAVAELDGCRRERLSMAASAYSETLVRPLAGGLGDRVEAFMDRFGVEIVATDREIARRAAELRAADGVLRLPDALVVATAQLRSARLLTFDGRLARLARRDEPSDR